MASEEAMIMIHASAEKNHLTTMKIFIEEWNSCKRYKWSYSLTYGCYTW